MIFQATYKSLGFVERGHIPLRVVQLANGVSEGVHA